MELTRLKNIQNTGEVNEENLPGYSIGKIFKKGGFLGEGGGLDKFLGYKNDTFGTNGAAIGTAATGVLDMVGSIGAASKFNRTADDLLRDAGTSQNNIGGVGYTVQNGLDDKQIESETNAESTSSTLGLTAKGAATGAAIASVIPGVGTAVGGIVGGVAGLVGGLFGGGAKKREMKRQMRLAEIKRINTNSFNQSGALTTVLQNNLAQTEGNQEDQALYGAANGKESYSAGGPTSGYNARVSNGEIIANKFTGEMFRVPGIPNNKDGKLAFIRPSDTIISNKYGLSDYVANTGDLEGGEAMQGTIMKALGKRGYKNGKLPGYKFGLEEINAIGNLGLGALSMLDSYNKRNESVKSPNTYVGNTWEAPALNIMRNIRTNAYPIMPQIYDNMAKGMYAIDNAGGLGGGQRTLARLAAITDAGNNIARLQAAAQEQNNKYQQDYAQAALNAGNADATRRMQANQWDLDYYSKAHGAREKMADQRRADALTFLQSYLKGVNDIHMYRGMMKHYQEEDDIKREDMRRKYGLNPDGTSATPDYTHYDNKSKYDATNIGETSYQYNPSVVPSSENIGQWIQALTNPKGQSKPEPKKSKIKTSSNGGDAYKFNPMVTTNITTPNRPHTSSNGSSQYMFNPMVDPYYTPSDQITAVLRFLGLPVKFN